MRIKKYRGVTLLAFVAVASPAFAGPKHWYQRGPLGGAERSIGCMAQPWKDWKCATMHYVILGASFADYLSTDYALRNCASCTEYNPLLGKRPSPARLYGQGIGMSLFTEHAFAQKVYDSHPSVAPVVASIDGTVHGVIALKQFRTTTDDSIRAQLGCLTCEVIRGGK